MNYAVIACRVFNRDLSAAVSKSENRCIVRWLPQGLHETPEKLGTEIRKTIDEIEKEQKLLPDVKKYDAILLCYGLCSNGIIGVTSKTIPIVIPRCDDCIALFLGSAEKYLKYFKEEGGTYWANGGWIEEGAVPSEEYFILQERYYREKYGDENAEFLMQESNKWLSNYSRLLYIESPNYNNDRFAKYTKKAAEYLGFEYKSVKGDNEFLTALLSSKHLEEQFLVLQSGEVCIESFDDRKIIKQKNTKNI